MSPEILTEDNKIEIEGLSADIVSASSESQELNVQEMASPPPKKKNIPAKKFNSGDRIVYPLQGVGNIKSIEKKDFKGQEILYYNIYIEATDMTIMLPVDKVNELGVRQIASKKESQDALTLIAQKYKPLTTDWKQRYQMNLDLLKRGRLVDIATVVQALYHRSKVKELPILERKLYDNALKILVDEISLSMNRENDVVEDMILGKLENQI